MELALAIAVGIASVYLIKKFVRKRYPNTLKLETHWPKGVIYVTVMDDSNATELNTIPVEPKSAIVNPNSAIALTIVNKIEWLNKEFRKRNLDITLTLVGNNIYNQLQTDQGRIEIVLLKDDSSSNPYIENLSGNTFTWWPDDRKILKRAIIFLRITDYSKILYHELFHALGIDGHTNDSNCMMYPEVSSFNPTEKDFEFLRSKYGN